MVFFLICWVKNVMLLGSFLSMVLYIYFSMFLVSCVIFFNLVNVILGLII